MKPQSIALFFILISVRSFAQWTPVDTVNSQYYSIHFTDGLTGYIGGYGFYKKTTDGGHTWHETTIANQREINKFCFFNNGTGIIGGTDNGAYRTVDNGSTWVADTAWTYPFCFLNNSLLGYCVAYTPFGYATPTFKTTDGGATWTEQGWVTPNPNGFFTGASAIAFSDTLHGCITAGEGSVYLTKDGGITWNRQTPYDSAYNFADVYMKDSLTIIVVAYQEGGVTGYDGSVILKTTDGGNTWKPVYVSPGGLILRRLVFASPNKGFACNDNLVETTDGGDTWTLNPDYYGAVDLSFPDSTMGYLLTWENVENTGNVLTLRFATGVPSFNDNFSPLDIYPNPAGDYAIIKTKAEALVKILDLTGKEVGATKIGSDGKIKLNTHNYSQGPYLINVSDESGFRNGLLLIAR